MTPGTKRTRAPKQAWEASSPTPSRSLPTIQLLVLHRMAAASGYAAVLTHITLQSLWHLAQALPGELGEARSLKHHRQLMRSVQGCGMVVRLAAVMCLTAALVQMCLIMDEVDGMSAGDRGGAADLIQTLKGAKLPIICICNDKYNQKLKSLRNHCLELDFRCAPCSSNLQSCASMQTVVQCMEGSALRT